MADHFDPRLFCRREFAAALRLHYDAGRHLLAVLVGAGIVEARPGHGFRFRQTWLREMDGLEELEALAEKVREEAGRDPGRP